MKRLLLLTFLLPLVSIAAYGQTCSGSDQLMTHLYNPTRLEVAKGCITVRGKVIAKMSQDDGDIHYRLKLDPGQGSGLINKGNDAKNQKRFLIFEPVCVSKIKANGKPNRPALAACRNFRQQVLLPNKGDHITELQSRANR